MGKRQVNDPRNRLFEACARLLSELKPKVLVMENVSGLNGLQSIRPLAVALHLEPGNPGAFF